MDLKMYLLFTLLLSYVACQQEQFMIVHEKEQYKLFIINDTDYLTITVQYKLQDEILHYAIKITQDLIKRQFPNIPSLCHIFMAFKNEDEFTLQFTPDQITLKIKVMSKGGTKKQTYEFKMQRYIGLEEMKKKTTNEKQQIMKQVQILVKKYSQQLTNEFNIREQKLRVQNSKLRSDFLKEVKIRTQFDKQIKEYIDELKAENKELKDSISDIQSYLKVNEERVKNKGENNTEELKRYLSEQIQKTQAQFKIELDQNKRLTMVECQKKVNSAFQNVLQLFEKIRKGMNEVNERIKKLNQLIKGLGGEEMNSTKEGLAQDVEEMEEMAEKNLFEVMDKQERNKKQNENQEKQEVREEQIKSNLQKEQSQVQMVSQTEDESDDEEQDSQYDEDEGSMNQTVWEIETKYADRFVVSGNRATFIGPPGVRTQLVMNYVIPEDKVVNVYCKYIKSYGVTYFGVLNRQDRLFFENSCKLEDPCFNTLGAGETRYELYIKQNERFIRKFSENNAVGEAKTFIVETNRVFSPFVEMQFPGDIVECWIVE